MNYENTWTEKPIQKFINYVKYLEAQNSDNSITINYLSFRTTFLYFLMHFTHTIYYEYAFKILWGKLHKHLTIYLYNNFFLYHLTFQFSVFIPDIFLIREIDYMDLYSGVVKVASNWGILYCSYWNLINSKNIVTLYT